MLSKGVTLVRRGRDIYEKKESLEPFKSSLVSAIDTTPCDHPFLKKLHLLIHETPSSTRNPVLTYRDVNDYENCRFVADPFLIIDHDTYHLFFEIFNSSGGVIGHATSVDGGTEWQYDQVVLNTGKHLSFPYVFEHDGSYFMVPEEGGKNGDSINLYKAANFPTEWEKEQTLIEVTHHTGDTIVFRWEEKWWMFSGSELKNGLSIYYSDSLRSSEWKPHNENPVANPRQRVTRPAGRPIVEDDRIIVFFQDCTKQYGDKVRAYEVTALSDSEYSDSELDGSPILESSGLVGWNSGRMHHIDPRHVDGNWICAVDGDSTGRQLFGERWSIGILTDQ